MQCDEPQIQHAVRFWPLVVVAFVFVAVSGCGQEKQVEKKPASPPNAAVEFNGPGNRLDGTFQSVAPE